MSVASAIVDLANFRAFLLELNLVTSTCFGMILIPLGPTIDPISILSTRNHLSTTHLDVQLPIVPGVDTGMRKTLQNWWGHTLRF